MTLVDAAAAVRAETVSSRVLVDACLQRIDQTEGRIGAFASLQADAARAEAQRMDQTPSIGPLHGVPIAIKDVVHTEGVATEANCRALGGWIPERDATVVQRLRAAGAIVVGKTNTHELAFGVSCPASRNPWAFDRMTGGSSGGNAAALASRQVFGAIGTDTGGSVRIPSSYCGTTGLKTTRGLVPRDGTHMLSWTYDTIGPMARSAEDCALLLDVIAGRSVEDPYSSSTALRPAQPVDTIRIGVPDPSHLDLFDTDVEVRAVMEAAVDQLRSIAQSTVTISMPDTAPHAESGSSVVFVEAAALTERLRNGQPQRIGAEVSGLLAAGDAHTGVELARAMRVRQVLESAYLSVFDDQHVDVVVLPVTPNQVLAHRATELGGVPLIPAVTPFTFPVNGAGLPSIALPGGLARDGLPIGFQLIGRPFDERTLLALGEAFQRRTEYHALSPG